MHFLSWKTSASLVFSSNECETSSDILRRAISHGYRPPAVLSNILLFCVLFPFPLGKFPLPFLTFKEFLNFGEKTACECVNFVLRDFGFAFIRFCHVFLHKIGGKSISEQDHHCADGGGFYCATCIFVLALLGLWQRYLQTALSRVRGQALSHERNYACDRIADQTSALTRSTRIWYPTISALDSK